MVHILGELFIWPQILPFDLPWPRYRLSLYNSWPWYRVSVYNSYTICNDVLRGNSSLYDELLKHLIHFLNTFSPSPLSKDPNFPIGNPTNKHQYITAGLHELTTGILWWTFNSKSTVCCIECVFTYREPVLLPRYSIKSVLTIFNFLFLWWFESLERERVSYFNTELPYSAIITLLVVGRAVV